MSKQVKIILSMLLLLVAANVRANVDFAMSGIDGREYRLSDFKGKWVLVNFWATWCPPCLEEMPELEMFHNRHKDANAVVIGINYETVTPGYLQKFVDDQFISYPVVKMKNEKDSPFGNIPGLPTSFLVSPEGKVVARQVGTVTADSLESFIRNYKAE